MQKFTCFSQEGFVIYSKFVGLLLNPTWGSILTTQPSILMKIAIVTTCTNRKKASPHPLLCVNDLPKGDQQSLLFGWAGRVEKSSERIPAIHLYSGRGFSEIRKVTHNKSIDVWVVSAGLGLINGDKKVPSYNLTISPSAKEIGRASCRERV